MERKILVTIPMEEVHKRKITNIASDTEVIYLTPDKAERSIVQEAEIILGNVSVEAVKGSKNLKWIQLDSAGANQYTEEGILLEGTILTNSTGAYGLAIAEHMLSMLLSLQKKLNLYNMNQKEHVWRDEGPVTSIYGSKTLVVGLGDIGGEFAMRMHALGSKVYGIKRNKSKIPEYLEDIYQLDKLNDILHEFDIVALSLPETKETKNLFNSQKFQKMKTGAILLNVGRGSTVHTADLCEALNSGKLGGAGLDVVDIEPLPVESPLWDIKNLILTPHVSGGYHLKETLERIRKISIENLKSFYEKTPMKNLVDFKTGYRKFEK
ncbi:D-2-hydroxyacid dehydrogenase [Fusobacterium sp.]|uniref:D-2-hydroxyacid dehydrogenase n=1 Tax=Fusobacterium sp. TaxID=68766 RepID=UPI002903E652|nr:D-2-hydroxyacid dehydrogenase [Fusobacterium sp.]MDU1910009.1 D-2-hydroxyacid dehydrogenase [Fusobacterium sp.]